MTQLERVLIRLDLDLRQLNVDYAVVGGLAVSVRARPRMTFDIDVAVSVATDRDAAAVVHSLGKRGYRLERTLEHEASGRLAGVRLTPPPELDASIPVDLLFASSGIEDELASEAERLVVLKGVLLPVARVGHLIALKVLADRADRPQDRVDALALLAIAPADERELAKASLERIEQRGFDRGKDLLRALRELVLQLEAAGKLSP